jgi:hypothetical protein
VHASVRALGPVSAPRRLAAPVRARRLRYNRISGAPQSTHASPGSPVVTPGHREAIRETKLVRRYHEHAPKTLGQLMQVRDPRLRTKVGRVWLRCGSGQNIAPKVPKGVPHRLQLRTITHAPGPTGPPRSSVTPMRPSLQQSHWPARFAKAGA